MRVVNIINNINKYLAGEMLRYTDLEPFLDRTIDDLNQDLDSCYPSFSEFMQLNDIDPNADYDLFPDKYIRTVVIPGAAFYYYQADEEGDTVANSFGGMYGDGRYKMQRDFTIQVPDEYANKEGGYAKFDWDLGGSVGISMEDICGR